MRTIAAIGGPYMANASGEARTMDEQRPIAGLRPGRNGRLAGEDGTECASGVG